MGWFPSDRGDSIALVDPTGRRHRPAESVRRRSPRRRLFLSIRTMLISEIDFVGDQTAIRLYDKLGMQTTDDLREADVSMATLCSVEGIGVRTAHRILDATKEPVEVPAGRP